MSLARCSNGHMFSTRKHGNTCPYCNVSVDQNAGGRKGINKISNVDEDNSKTVAIFDDEFEGNDPVVGWLVCIEGPQWGQDYKIRNEKNFIGRSEEMHIQINGDNAISRRNHAIVTYNPLKRNFFLIPGDGVGLVFHNNEAVFSPIELTAYDVIQMGKSKFLFIPLCGIHFEWEKKES